MSTLTSDYLTAVRQPRQLDVSIAFFVLSFVSVALRLLSRRLVRARIQWDDILILFALVAYSGPFAAGYIATLYGSGRHVQSVSFNSVRPLLILTYVGELFYPIILTAIKCSIICLYLRLFGVNRKFARLAKISIGIAVVWGIITIFPVMFQCIPVYMIWDLFNPERHCLSIKPYFLATNTCEVAIDFLILILPIPQVWSLKLSTRRKVGVISIFLLGAFTTVVGIIRLVVVANLKQNDLTWDYIPIVNWSTVEMNVGIICACLPVIPPAMRMFCGNLSGTVAKPSFINITTPAGSSVLGNSYSLSSLLARETDVPPMPTPSLPVHGEV